MIAVLTTICYLFFASLHLCSKEHRAAYFEGTGTLTELRLAAGRAAGSNACAELEALENCLGLYIFLFHLNFMLLSQNQPPNSPPNQSLIGSLGLTVSLAVTASLITPSPLTATTLYSALCCALII